jgi:pimeloyl-ACP methyl ester carboxylesterase
VKSTEGVEANLMFVRRFGPRGRERGAVVFLHGLGDWGETFRVLAGHPALAGRRLLMPDLPGYGRSHGLTAAPATLEGVADVVERWLTDAGEGPVALVGHSMGALVGLLLAERYPRRPSLFVNVEGNLTEADCTVSGPAAAYSPEEFLKYGIDQIRKQVSLMAREDPSLHFFEAGLGLCDAEVFYAHARQVLALSRRGDLARRLAALPLPVHYVAGGPGGLSPEGHAALRAAAVPFTVLSSSGHYPFHDRPDRFGRLLGKLLEKYC